MIRLFYILYSRVGKVQYLRLRSLVITWNRCTTIYMRNISHTYSNTRTKSALVPLSNIRIIISYAPSSHARIHSFIHSFHPDGWLVDYEITHTPCFCFFLSFLASLSWSASGAIHALCRYHSIPVAAWFSDISLMNFRFGVSNIWYHEYI